MHFSSSAFSLQLSAISYQLSAISYQLSAVKLSALSPPRSEIDDSMKKEEAHERDDRKTPEQV
jgi:hypothetical protein